ncbi:hypothetical protein N7453_005211 [Penicillium expansum]|nr:hypothetical protein N7453_005211 [Penicillium expansum]
MRWVSTFFALALTGALQANALDATIFTFSPKTATSLAASHQQQTISEDEARLVLELRMKSSVASVLGTVDADTVNHLNQFAQDDLSLFGGVTGGDCSQEKYLYSGRDRPGTLVMQKAQPNHLHIPQISSPFVGFDLLESFTESSPTAKGDRGQICTYFNDASRAASSTSQTPKECLSRDPMFADGSDLLSRDSLILVDSVESWISKDHKDSALTLSFKNPSGDSLLRTKLLERLLLHLAQVSLNSNREITTVILPSGFKPERLSRRGAKQSSAPVTQQNAFRRSTQNSALQSTLAPVCHASNSSCAESTNDCSGHGSCYLKYGSGAEGTTGNCYACQCKQSVVQNSDGTTKTVHLLAIVLVGSAIGMLFSMGSQELPSVISAGVGGPKSQI